VSLRKLGSGGDPEVRPITRSVRNISSLISIFSLASNSGGWVQQTSENTIQLLFYLSILVL
jgi:hypothetical protein